MQCVTSSNSPGSPPPWSFKMTPEFPPAPPEFLPVPQPGDRFAQSACGAWPAQLDSGVKKQRLGMWRVDSQYLESWIFNYHFFSAENIFLLGCFLILNAHLNQEKTRLYPDRGVFTLFSRVFYDHFPGNALRILASKRTKWKKCCKYAHLEKICSKHFHISNEHLLCFCAM